jgi:membrane-bound metal-dependent hydrolase YbcI (DUF457 family)
MDPFSHLLLGYLLGFGIWGPASMQFVVAAAIAGALPDADVLFYPVSRRFPLLRHRAISHSLVGVTAIAAVGAFVVPPAMAWGLGPGFAVGSPLVFFAAMEIGGLSHVLLDSLDHWSVQIFAPFSRRQYHFDADRIVNVGAMGFTVFSYTLMLYERNRIPVGYWVTTSWLLLAAVVLYLGVRILGRWLVEEVRRQGQYDGVIPQGNPLRFLLARKDKSGGRLRLDFARYRLIAARPSASESLDLALTPPPKGEVRSVSEALSSSYGPSLEASWILGDTYHFAVAREVPGAFEVFWYSLEFSFWSRFAGVLVRVDAHTGAVTTRTAWRNPSRAFD